MSVVSSLVSVAFWACLFSAVSLHPTTHTSTNSLSRTPVQNTSCVPKVCFAIDGSGSLSYADFQKQKKFVMDVATALSKEVDDVRYAAAQYGVGYHPIARFGFPPRSPLTDNERYFFRRVNSTYREWTSWTSTAAGIEFCFLELVGEKDVRGPSAIVLIGDGRDNVKRDPIPLARFFKGYFGRKGMLNTVTVGFSDEKAMEKIADVGGGRSYRIDEYRRVFAAIYLLTRHVCD